MIEKDIKIIDKFLHDFFLSNTTIPYHKIYLSSLKYTKEKKLVTYICDLMIQYAKKKMAKMLYSIENINKSFLWFTDNLNILCKIFRTMKNISKIRRKIHKLFKRKIFKNREVITEQINKFYLDLNSTNKEIISNILDVISFYKIKLHDKIQNKILNNFLQYGFEDISKIKTVFDNLDFKLINVKTSLCDLISDKLKPDCVFECFISKRNLQFLEIIYENNLDKYKSIVNKYISNRYKLKDANIQSQELFEMYCEYKQFKGNLKKIFYETFLSIEINNNTVINKLHNVMIANNKNLEDKWISLQNYVESERNVKKFKVETNEIFFEFIGFLFSITENKEEFEQSLRTFLCTRLINFWKIDLIKEDKLIEKIKSMTSKIYVYKLEDVLSDYRQRTIFENFEIMTLRKYQWIAFENNAIEIPEISQFKKDFETKLLKYERKQVKWMDYLSSVEIEIENNIFLISLIQYDIINKILSNGFTKLEDFKIKSEMETDVYKRHFDKLIQEKFLIYKNDMLFINANCSVNYLLVDNKYQVDRCNNYLSNLEIKHLNEIIDSKIVKLLKQYKKIKIDDFLISEISNNAYGRLNELQIKGYCSIKNGYVEYIS